MFCYTVLGAAPSVALHIAWDRVNDDAHVRWHAEGLSLRPGVVDPNLFQEDAYQLGSLCHSDPKLRRQVVDHLLDCVEIPREIEPPSVRLFAG